MSSNRVQYFIRSILQNSKLNREKFVKNKKKYNDKNKINHNLILKRNFNTNSYGLPPPNFNNNNNNNWLLFTGAALGVYFYNKKK
jgi:hypothetical protein